MIRCFLLVLLVLLALGCLAGTADAQPNRVLPVEDWTADYIVRLQRRGHLLDLHPTAFPYRQGDVRAALAQIDRTTLNRTEQHWVRLLEAEVEGVTREDGEAVVGLRGEAGLRVINSDRLDVVRPLGDTLNPFFYTIIPAAYVDVGPFIAAAGWRQDSYYDQDPDGLDTALRLLTRNENSYVSYHSPLLTATLGRQSNLWGVPGEAAALLSDNPRSQDHLLLRLGGERVRITGLLSELDSIRDDGRFTGRVADDTVRVGNRRRYLAAHRYDWRPSRHFMLSAMESAIYSGSNAGPSLKYLNPLHAFLFLIDNTPKNEENNGFVGALLWAQLHRFTLHGQWVVDDFDSRGESGTETISFTLLGSLTYAGPTFDAGVTLEVVAPRTYNAPQPEGQYLYLLRGLGTAFSDYVHAAAFADVYLDALAPGLRLTPRLDVLAQGTRDLRQPFPAPDEAVDFLLDGTPERTVRTALQVVYQPMPWWWVRLDGGLNFVSNVAHVPDQSATRFVGLATVGLRLKLDHAYRLSLP